MIANNNGLSATIMPLKVAVLGASGRMGQMLLRTGAAHPGVRLVAASDRDGSDWIGRSLGDVIPDVALSEPNGADIIVSSNAEDAFSAADAVVDFTMPEATIRHSKLAAEIHRIHVIGTTGFTDEELDRLKTTEDQTVTIRAGNMSLGVNLLTTITRQVAKALDDDFDIEVVEMHHNRKVDAPSGTALMLGEAAAEGRGVNLSDAADRGRDGITGARRRGDIGFAALRGGDVVGEHEVIFAAAGERIVLSHIATDRAIFARGAIKAALWGRGREPGAYTMLDVLGLS